MRNNLLIGLDDETIELSLRQLQLLFLNDQFPDPPSRVVARTYDALEERGLIEQGIRRRVSEGVRVCRPTERGRAVSDLAVVEDVRLR